VSLKEEQAFLIRLKSATSVPVTAHVDDATALPGGRNRYSLAQNAFYTTEDYIQYDHMSKRFYVRNHQRIFESRAVAAVNSNYGAFVYRVLYRNDNEVGYFNKLTQTFLLDAGAIGYCWAKRV